MKITCICLTDFYRWANFGTFFILACSIAIEFEKFSTPPISSLYSFRSEASLYLCVQSSFRRAYLEYGWQFSQVYPVFFRFLHLLSHTIVGTLLLRFLFDDCHLCFCFFLRDCAWACALVFPVSFLSEWCHRGTCCLLFALSYDSWFMVESYGGTPNAWDWVGFLLFQSIADLAPCLAWHHLQPY